MAPNSIETTRRLSLKILATSDVHGALTPTENDETRSSLSHAATLIDDIRASHRNCLVFDNGDFLQGKPLCDYCSEAQNELFQHHPVIRAMNHVGYDAVGLGNHEFDYGIDFLNTGIKQANFPVLSANIQCDRQNWRPSVILERDFEDEDGETICLKIGVFSLLPEQVIAWNNRHLAQDAQTFDIFEAATREAQTLKAADADLVICLLHSGIGAQQLSEKMENAALPIAECVPIDALICGHSHRQFPLKSQKPTLSINHHNGTLFGVPTVQPGCDAAWLGEITLELEKDAMRTQVLASTSRLLSTREAKSNKALRSLLEPYHKECASYLAEPVGRINVPIHSYFSRLPGDPAVALTAFAQREFIRIHANDLFPENIPVLSAASPTKAGGWGGPNNYIQVNAGTIAQEDLTKLHPFQNTLVALHINGQSLREWLEMSASSYNRLNAEKPPQPLRDPAFPCYGFDTIFGVTYEINLTQPARYDVSGKKVGNGERIQDLRWNSKPVHPDQSFVLLTNSYRAGGGGNFPGATTSNHFDLPLIDCRSILSMVLARGVRGEELPTSPWKFSDAPNMSACVQIGSGALDILKEGYGPEIGLNYPIVNSDGFLEFLVEFDASPKAGSIAFPKRSAYIRN
ncbi:Trifunctional nucleotide phosphoesterase protein YfkN precursor [Cognatishimia activa]|uniref:Trifunctional nucleotide phosphoesterase protein YfkN n=1 Tax=Cognatishimia activa TaxID=1715691 RepID=A0A0P1IVJ1_9RHOB|nr:Trifunctional nucleotide phosphoesterase protein YfkN precursor [Cognatishimia activa]CUK26014.1 Trifunctional nucleotide phosphoesterase protein YfkN precursor [Cognatishimia activa]